MTDEELSVYIDECIDKGFATQEDIAKSFGFDRGMHILNNRIMIHGELFLRGKWSALVKQISETYETARPTDVVRIVKDDSGIEKDVGLAVQVRRLSRAGLDKADICNALRINPKSFYVNPRLEQEFRVGQAESRHEHQKYIENVLTRQLIHNRWFEKEGLPTWKKLAKGYIVSLNKDEYQVKQSEKGEDEFIFVKRTVQQKEIKPDKEALTMLTKIAGRGLISSNLTELPEIEAGLQVNNEPLENFDNKGRFIADDAEFIEVEDDK